MCLDVKVGLLQRREDWQKQLRELFADDKEQEYVREYREAYCSTYIVIELHSFSER